MKQGKVTSRRLVRLAQKAMKRASRLTAAEVRSLAGCVLAQADDGKGRK